MATITKRTTSRGVTYRAAIRRTGFPKTIKTFSTKKQAEAWARKVEAGLESLKAGTAAAERVTFAQCVDEYMAQYTGKDASRAQRIAPFGAAFGSAKLATITPDHIRAVLDELASGSALRGDGKGRRATAGRPRSGATINRYLAAASVAFKFAMQYHGLRENPCHRVQSRPEGKPRDRVLNNDEQAALLDACKRSSWARMYLLVLMACMTGARKGELKKLRYSDLDWQARSATFRDTKNGDTRVVPLPDLVMGELRRFPGIGDALVFASDRVPSNAFEFTKQWHQAVREAGLEGTGVVFHSLRHSAVTRLANTTSEHEAMQVAKFVGHRDLRTTMRYYHPDAEASRSLVDVLAASVNGGGA